MVKSWSQVINVEVQVKVKFEGQAKWVSNDIVKVYQVYGDIGASIKFVNPLL